jgi:hypothetical protein
MGRRVQRATLVALGLVGVLAGAACVPAAGPRGADPEVPAPPAPGGPPAPPETAVLTQKGDVARLGWSSHETVLDTSGVQPGRFGRRVSYPVDGQVYAQPLFVPGLAVRGARHNTVVVATERDTVYAFDADARGTVPPPLWRTSLLAGGARPLSSRTDVSCDAIQPAVGVTGTPIIDPDTMTLYVVAASREGSRAVYRLHALDLATGHDRLPPVVLQASVPGGGTGSAGGRQTFVPAREQQRMGLLLLHGVVYAAFASYCDRSPSAGWILGYRASDLGQAVVWDDTADGYLGGLWESGTGLSADDDGHIFVVSGNGSFDLDSGGRDAGNSLLELEPAGGTLAVVDYFSPFNQACLNHHDQELGSSGLLLLRQHGEVVLTGKEGRVYVTAQGHLGGYRTVPDACNHQERTDVDQVVQELPQNSLAGGVWGSPSYWSGDAGELVYTAGIADHLKAWRVAGGRIVTPPVSEAPESLDYPGGVPVVSSSGGAAGTGIVWLLDQAHGPALRAYDAAALGRELYSSQQNPKRDGLGSYVKFSVPTVANGRVFVGTASALVVFGPLN